MAEQIQETGTVPPPGEAIHLPGPSYLPAIVALGLTLAVVGVVINPFVCAAGVLITLYAILRWVGDTRRDIAELPLEHDSH
jgi:hypothetical protein